MIELDPSKLPPAVAPLLFGRGAGVPPLVWSSRADRTAKKTLDEIDDAALVGSGGVADEEMLAAVRALLYLWNGWIGESRMYAEGASEAERLYLSGLCERQAGNPDAAKTVFRQLDGHSIFEPLTQSAVKVIGLGADPLVDRFVQILKLGEAWEPFAFIDVYEQARAGKLSQASQHLVCCVQCVEFEWLFCHCYTAAAATAVPLRRRPEAPVPRPHKRPTPSKRRSRPARTEAPAHDAGEAQHAEPRAPARPMIALRCPRCGSRLRVPEEGRGAKARCDKCGSVFLIPKRQSQSA